MDEISPSSERTLSEPIGYYVAQKTAEETEWTYSGGDRQWLPIPAYPLALSWSSSIDLSGYALQRKTFFPVVGFLQQSPIIALDAGAAIHMMTVISSTPLDVDLLMSGMLVGTTPDVITEDWETILYCRSETYAANQTIPSAFNYLALQNFGQTGSLQPTAADKLFVYRIALPISTTSLATDFTRIQLPSCRVGLIGQMTDEPELEYMMRLKRSYELANQV